MTAMMIFKCWMLVEWGGDTNVGSGAFLGRGRLLGFSHQKFNVMGGRGVFTGE